MAGEQFLEESDDDTPFTFRRAFVGPFSGIDLCGLRGWRYRDFTYNVINHLKGDFVIFDLPLRNVVEDFWGVVFL